MYAKYRYISEKNMCSCLYMFKQELTVREVGILLPVYKIIWGSTVSG